MEIKQRFNHSKLGNFMFKVTAIATKYLVKHRIIYYILSFTWGLPMTIVGILVSIFLLFLKLFNSNIKFTKYKWNLGIEIKDTCWGGFSSGLIFVKDEENGDRIQSHEFGHSFQNCIFGPFMIFIVAIPSVIRYWYQNINDLLDIENKPYDKIWFEDSATQCGNFAKNILK